MQIRIFLIVGLSALILSTQAIGGPASGIAKKMAPRDATGDLGKVEPQPASETKPTPTPAAPEPQCSPRPLAQSPSSPSPPE